MRRIIRRLMQRLDADSARPVAYLGDHTVLTRLRDGPKIFLDTRDLSVAPHLILDGCWEVWVRDALRPVIRPGMRVADIGANVGYFTLLAADWVGPRGHVLAVEPNPRLAELLRQSVTINGFAPRVSLHEVALSDAPGPVQLAIPRRLPANSSMVRDFEGYFARFPELRGGFPVDAVEVRADTLDRIAAEEGPFDVIKVDAEGAEPLVMAGAREVIKRSPGLRMVLEYAPERLEFAGVAPAEFLGELERHGFAFQVIEHSGMLRPTTPAALASETPRQSSLDLLLSRR